MASVTAPSGLSVTRNGNNYNYTWKLGQKYTAQVVNYRFGNGPVSTMTLGGDTTSTTITFNKNSYPYYPSGIDKVTALHFTLVGKNGSSSSASVSKDYSISVPPTPEITVEHSSSVENETTFSWRINWGATTPYEILSTNKDTGNQIFTSCEIYTKLVKDCEQYPENMIDWEWETRTPIDVDSGSWTFRENIPLTGSYSYTRCVMIVAEGPGGDSYPAWAKYVYSIPNVPRNVSATSIPLMNTQQNYTSDNNRFYSGYAVTVNFNIDGSNARPVDEALIQYAIGTPVTSYTDDNGVRKVNFSTPLIESWTTAGTIRVNAPTPNYFGVIDDRYSGSTHTNTFIIDHEIPDDEWVFVRVVAKHGEQETASEPVLVESHKSRSHLNLCGYLNSPSGLSAQINDNIATISVDNNSEISASCVAIYYRSDKNSNPRIIGIKPANSSAAISVQLPDEDATAVSLGAKTFLMDYGPNIPSLSGVTEYTQYRIYGESYEIIWDDRPVPKPPTNISLTSPRSGVVRVTWDWSWVEANGVEISWTDHDDAWESTDAPQTYNVENRRATAWNVVGLDLGTWYFKLRLYKIDGESITYGTYSDTYSIKLSSSPSTPVLTVTPSTVTPDGKITCYWTFTTTEGDEQLQADICEATFGNDGTVQYGQIIDTTNQEQFKTLSIQDLHWEAGSTHYLAVRTITASGEKSNDWSTPKPVQVLLPITASIDSTSLETITVVDDEDRGISHQQLSLTEMPLQVSASGAGTGGTMTYIIERSGDYRLDRPDEDTIMGFDRETIAIIEQSDKNNNGTPNFDIVIDNKDLIGRLDDGAYYNLIAIAKDTYGQTNQAPAINFAVHWSHQAVAPTATIEVDNEEDVVFITPIQPQIGYESGDTCDIYRLSLDKPELIFENAAFGTKYVDPYPTLGQMGGHRVVYKTVNGDYITEDNEFAWTDYGYDDGDFIDRFATIIDFGDDKAVLPYDLSLSSKWNKDFVQTKYLGGSIEGDWNAGIERTGMVKTRVAVKQDSELIDVIRRLAIYPGVCHIRTPDGSSFAANINVSEDREEKKINMIASFTLEINRVDSVGFDGIPYSDWVEGV